LMRSLIDHAQSVQRRLAKALISAHDDQRRGGFALREAETSFWRDSEPTFHRWLAGTAALDEWTDEAAHRAQTMGADMNASIRRSALNIFDAHVEISEFDPAKAARIATARRSLRNDLYSPASRRPAATPVTGEHNDHAAK